MASARTNTYRTRQRRQVLMTRWVAGLICGAMALTFLGPALLSVAA